MPRRMVIDPLVQNEIEHSRRRLEKSQNAIISIRSRVDASRKVIDSSRALLRSLPERSIDHETQPIIQNPLIEMDDENLSEIVEDLTAAYLQARAMGDDNATGIFGNALLVIGRRLAKRLGPKAGGVRLN